MLRMGIDITFIPGGAISSTLLHFKTAGLDLKDVARQIQMSGTSIPARGKLRRCWRITSYPHIPRCYGLTAGCSSVSTAIANLFGVIGAVSGTGLLLTVSITYRLYEEIASLKYYGK